MLWIALNYVSLKSWIQRPHLLFRRLSSCELLWIMYLWKVEYNKVSKVWSSSLLWIALNYVSLKSWIQHVVIWSQERLCCELLWIMYLWKVEYNPQCFRKICGNVVNCFELCIFEKLNTTTSSQKRSRRSCELLWIMYLWKVEYNKYHLCRQT